MKTAQQILNEVEREEKEKVKMREKIIEDVKKKMKRGKVIK